MFLHFSFQAMTVPILNKTHPIFFLIKMNKTYNALNKHKEKRLGDSVKNKQLYVYIYMTKLWDEKEKFHYLYLVLFYISARSWS